MSEVKRAYDLLRGYVAREWDRIRGVEGDEDAWGELENSTSPNESTTMTTTTTSQPQNPKAFARSILGVSETATFAEIRRAFERLSRRSAPSNFTAGSEEAGQAEDILKRVNWAYRTLTEEIDSVQMRFSSLEIDETPPAP